jgi:16S rRNA (guanine966-N2)-methyltransferase
MKDRVREAVFNLVGPSIRGTHAIDLFAGSGALGLEAISRGAERATLIERHFPTAELIRRNVRSLGLEQQASVLAANAFLWVRHELPARALDRTTPWTVFCSPPYDFYVDRRDEMLQMIELLREGAPAGSLLVVESDLRFSVQQLACAQGWDERTYRQARVAVLQIASSQ